MYVSAIELVNLARAETENNKWRLQRKKEHISILKSFIVLQKSNYYLTRKKDKWQIIYITNARPAHIVPPVSHGIQRTNPPLSFQTASKNLSGWIWGFGCCWSLCCDLRLENGTLRYIHSQCSFLPSPVRPVHFGIGWLWTTVGADLHWHKSGASPLEQGFS